MPQLLDLPDLPPGFADFNDFREAARRRLPHYIFEYLDGGIGRDVNRDRNYSAMDRVLITPRVNEREAPADTSVELFGESWSFPFGVAPVGVAGSFHQDAARVLAVRAAKLNLPFCLSLVAGHSTEEIAAAAGRPPWQQLYWPDLPDVQKDILARMQAHDVKVIMPTIDIPAWQWRERTIRSGLTPKPNLGRQIHTLLTRPAFTIDTLRRGRPKMPNVGLYVTGGLAEQEAFLAACATNPLGVEAMKKLRDEWDGALVVKGVMAPEDAEALAAIGVDGIVVSNHGGRQLDAAPATAELLPPIAAAVKGRTKILADGGVANGLDVLRLIRLGADFVMAGRLPYFAANALGRRGAGVLDMLAIQTQGLMYQLGVRALDELGELKMTVDPA